SPMGNRFHFLADKEQTKRHVRGFSNLRKQGRLLNAPESAPCFNEIILHNFKSDEVRHATTSRCDGGISDAKKRVEHPVNLHGAVQFDTPFGELNRESSRMRTFFFPALDCFVWNKPSVAATTHVAPLRMRPATDVALVLIRNA